MADMNTTRRGLLGAMAAVSAVAAVPAVAGTPLAHSDFDTALRAYYRARDADRRDVKQGTLRAAYNLYDRQTKGLIAKYGDNKAACAGPDKERWDTYFKVMSAAEEQHTKDYSEPRWDAFEVVCATPAPTAAALMLKIEVAIEEDGDTDNIVDFVRSDLRRLGAN